MAAITIRNLPDEVVEALKKRAKRNARSMEAEARDVLARATGDESGIERAATEAVRVQRFFAPGYEIMARIEANPPTAEEQQVAEEWAEQSRRDREHSADPLVDPWERAAELLEAARQRQKSQK